MREMAAALRWVRRRLPLSWARFLVALLVGLTGVANMASIFFPRLDSYLDGWLLDLDLESSVRVVAAVVGFLLIMLSRGLFRGKRKAWELTLWLLGLSAFFHAARGGWVLASWGTLLALLLVGTLRPLFQARSDPPSVLRGYSVLLVGLALVFVYTVGGFYWLRTQFAPVVHLEGALRLAIHTITWMRVARHIPQTPQARWFLAAVPWLSLSALLFGVAQVLRPVGTALLPAPHERALVTSLLREWGTSSISYVALSSEKAYFFHTSGQAVLAYRLAGNIAVVAGDPLGPPALLPELLAEFSAYCRQQDWQMVFWQVAPEVLPLYAAQGLQAMKIGEDAVLDLPTFSLQGSAMEHLRAMVRRAERAGLQVRFFHDTIDEPALAAQMQAIADAWLAAKGGVEMGFSMSRFGERLDLETVFAAAVDGAGRVHAFVSFVPIYGRNGWTLDLMRRAAGAANGTMELLLARSVEHFALLGAKMVGLGLAPLANTCGEPASNLEQLCYFITSRFGGLDRAASLYNFKRKFQPRWESRYLVYPSTLALPRVGLALVAAHHSRQWLPWSRAGARRKVAGRARVRPVPHVA